MQRITVLIWTISNLIQPSYGGCPHAKFQFHNQTQWATYHFVDSSVGNIGSLETCPYTGRPYVYLPCYTNSSWGNEPYFSNCLRPLTSTTTTIITSATTEDSPPPIVSLEEIARFPLNTSEAIVIALGYLNDERLPLNSSLHFASTVNILHRIGMTHPQADVLVHSNFYSIVNKLLSSASAAEIKSAEQNNRSLTQLVSSLDNTVEHLVADQPDLSFIQDNLAVSLVRQPNNRTQPIVGFTYDATTNTVLPISAEDENSNFTSIVLTSPVVADQNRLIFSIFHQRNGLFDDGNSRLLTPMVSLMLDKPQTVLNAGSVVKVNFQVEDSFEENNRSLKCAYWSLSSNHTAQWLTDGCQLTNRTKHSVTCLCEYRTHLAVLMEDELSSTTPRLIEQMLSIITLIGLGLSSISLCLTILTFTLFKKLRRHFSQKSLLLLSINFLFVNILFALIDLYTRDQFKDLLCVVIASFLHYFVLSTFSWMLVLAVIQYLLFVKVFPHAVSAFTRKAAAFAQLTPLIPVIVVLVVDPWNSTKRTDQICWLSSLPFYLSFILPISLIIFIIGVLFFIVGHSFFCGKSSRHVRSNQMGESHRRSRFSIAFCCFVALTLTWIFALFAIGPVRLVLQILFCIFGSLASFLIFLLYLITSKAKRPYWNNTLKSLGMPTIYSPTSSSSSGFLSTREFSISSNSDHQKLPARRPHFASQAQHFIDAYMPSSPPPPAPPVQPPLLLEGDDPLHPTSMTHQFYEPRHLWAPQTNFIYETNQPTTTLDDYSLYYASNHNATKL